MDTFRSINTQFGTNRLRRGGGGGGGFETTSNSAVAVSKLENSIKNPRSTPNGESDLWDPNGVGCLWDKNDPNTFPDPLAP